MARRKFITAAHQELPDGRKTETVKFDRPMSVYEALMATKPARQ